MNVIHNPVHRTESEMSAQQDPLRRLMAVQEPIGKHMGGLHEQEADPDCIECDRRQLAWDLEQLRASRDRLLTACDAADLVEDNFLTTPEIRAFFAEAVSDRG